MIIMEYEVFYEHAPSISNPFPLEDEDIEHNFRLLPNDLEHFLQDTRVITTKEDYENQRICIRIESGQPKEVVESEMKRALSMSKLFGKQLNCKTGN
jgi:hypothetical protein